MYSHESTDMVICDILDYLESISTHGAHAFAMFDSMTSLCSYMITCTHPLYVNGVGDIIHLLGQLFQLSGDDFISICFNFKSLHHLGADYNSQDISHHWILVFLHGPSFHRAVVLDPGEQISLLPKKKITPDISIYFGEASGIVQHFWFSSHVLS